MPKLVVIFITCLIMLLSACGERLTALKTTNVDNAFGTRQPEPKPATTALTAPPTAITDALIPDFNQSLLSEATHLGSASFNISVHDVEARDFFMSLVADSQENMVVHPDVSGRISLELKNVNIAQVLSTVQKVYGYDYAKSEIGYIIYPATLQTKIFKIDRLDLQREGNSNTRVTSGQINNTPRNNVSQSSPGMTQGGSASGMGGSVPGMSSGNMANNNTNSGSWISTTSKTDFWEELSQSLSAIVDVSNGSHDEFINTRTGNKVVINKQTGIVVVRCNPTQMREVENLIASTQNQIGRQVAIEAKILEITLNSNHQNGINWGDIIHKAQASLMSGVLPASSATTAAAAFTIGVKSGDFYAFIELMEGQGKTNILSSPRISTLNNQKAIIKVGQDQYFITNVSSNNSLAGANSVVTQDVTWTPFFNGIALDVTPQISEDDYITLHIHPTVTIVSVDEKKFDINGQSNDIPMALNKVRESDSIVKAESGQIIVIGGLMQTNFLDNQQGVTLLTQIPYLGNLFRENSGTGQKSELVILLKPTVINANNDWQPAIENSREHLQDLESKKLWR